MISCLLALLIVVSVFSPLGYLVEHWLGEGEISFLEWIVRMTFAGLGGLFMSWIFDRKKR